MSQRELLEEGARRRSLGDVEGARNCFRRAVERSPEAAEAHHHLAASLEALGRLDEAEVEYRVALALAPESGSTARALAVLLLSRGRYAEGFALFERRHELADLAKPALPFPEWRGEPVAGRKILVWPEQGFGDQIQFARFAPILRRRGADVTLVCWPPLARLFELSLGVRVVPAVGAVEFPDPDYWVMAMSLAARLGLTPQTLPGGAYLNAPPLPTPLADGARIGLLTRGNPNNANDANRSLGADQAARLAALAGAVSLDPADTGAQDFADTAAIVQSLDLVISVDTAVAHLAGALGKPCWTLLPQANTDWRWLRDRRDSPWYPSMRLFRQSSSGDWAGVIDEVMRALGEEVR
ncbi:MAG: tetratricopeptide repeat protein [Caulobacterales bacterium]